MYSRKEVAVRAAIGATMGTAAMLAFRGWPSDAEKTASVVVAAVAGGLALVGRGLEMARRSLL